MQPWKIALTAFLAGLLIGMAALYLVLSGADEAAGAPQTAPAGESPMPAAVVAADSQLQARIGEQQLEIDRLNSLLRQLRAAPPPPPEAAAPPAEPRGPGFGRNIDGYAAQRADELAGSLGLSDDQRARLQDIFKAQFENMRDRRHGGDVPPYSLDEALAGVLTPEQFSAYLESTQQEIYNRAELLATTQVVRLNQLVQLAPEQMDPVYEAINYTAQELMIARQTGEDFDMRQALEQRLSTVLTGEQMARYREDLMNSGPGSGRGPGFFGP